MKERSNSNHNSSSSASGTSSNVVNVSSESSGTHIQNPPNFLSPYDSINFMAPPIGATIKCITCLGNNVQGKVIAYDNQTKMLALSWWLDFLDIECILKRKSDDYFFPGNNIKGSPIPNKPGFYDYSMVNVSWCSNLEVVEETTEAPETIAHLNHNKVNWVWQVSKYFKHQ